MWSIVVLTWLLLQVPVALALGRLIACPQKTTEKSPRRSQEVKVQVARPRAA
jgi:hypothetical protein